MALHKTSAMTEKNKQSTTQIVAGTLVTTVLKEVSKSTKNKEKIDWCIGGQWTGFRILPRQSLGYIPVYNTIYEGIRKADDGTIYKFTITKFPSSEAKESSEWKAVDLCNNRGLASLSLEDLVRLLYDALDRELLKSEKLIDIGRTFGTIETQEAIRHALRLKSNLEQNVSSFEDSSASSSGSYYCKNSEVMTKSHDDDDDEHSSTSESSESAVVDLRVKNLSDAFRSLEIEKYQQKETQDQYCRLSARKAGPCKRYGPYASGYRYRWACCGSQAHHPVHHEPQEGQ